MRTTLFLLALTIIGVSGCKPAASTGGVGQGSVQAKKTYARDELRAMVMGKTMEEVIALIGRPEKTDEDSDGRMMMTYDRIAVDPGTSKAGAAFLHLEKSKVARVNY